jgi:hypothetical protein
LFAGGWGGHSGGVVIKTNGSFTISLRTYRWCTQEPKPCDSVVNDVIMDGDTAIGHLLSSSGHVATGVVTKTSDATDTPTGAITFILYPSADIISVSGIGNLCGRYAVPGTCGA